MAFKYAKGFIAANLYRFLRVFPNSDPMMGFIIPAAKNEKWWKAPLFAFSSMVIFDIFTSGIGLWTWATAFTYAGVALLLRKLLSGRKSTIKLFISAGVIGVLAFDLITGPLMSTFLFKQEFLVTILLQIPFTIMHTISAVFGIIIISPFYDQQIMKEITQTINAVKNTLVSWRLNL